MTADESERGSQLLDLDAQLIAAVSGWRLDALSRLLVQLVQLTLAQAWRHKLPYCWIPHAKNGSTIITVSRLPNGGSRRSGTFLRPFCISSDRKILTVPKQDATRNESYVPSESLVCIRPACSYVSSNSGSSKLNLCSQRL